MEVIGAAHLEGIHHILQTSHCLLRWHGAVAKLGCVVAVARAGAILETTSKDGSESHCMLPNKGHARQLSGTVPGLLNGVFQAAIILRKLVDSPRHHGSRRLMPSQNEGFDFIA